MKKAIFNIRLAIKGMFWKVEETIEEDERVFELAPRRWVFAVVMILTLPLWVIIALGKVLEELIYYFIDINAGDARLDESIELGKREVKGIKKLLLIGR